MKRDAGPLLLYLDISADPEQANRITRGLEII